MIARRSRPLSLGMTEIVTLPRQAVRSRLAWVLPALFAAATTLGALWPGSGGRLFCIGALAGIWACLLVDSTGGPSAWLVPTLLGGVPILFFLGRLLDRLQTDLRVWGIALFVSAALAGFLLMQDHVDLERAIEYHGSFWAYAVCALQLGSYAATLIALVIGAGSVARRP